MPMTQDEFDHKRALLCQTIGTLGGVFIQAFPDGFIFDPDAHLFGLPVADGQKTTLRPVCPETRRLGHGLGR